MSGFYLQRTIEPRQPGKHRRRRALLAELVMGWVFW